MAPTFPIDTVNVHFSSTRNLWYSMTVEFLADELVAHIDPDLTSRTPNTPSLTNSGCTLHSRSDDGAAQLDNVQILHR